MVNHTSIRLITAQEEVLSQNIDNLSGGLTIIYKWGCDESSGHSQYKQHFSEEFKSDEFLFAACLVPLQLKLNLNNTIIWHNPRPLSIQSTNSIIIRKRNIGTSKEDN